MVDVEVGGEWWLPGHEDRKVPGLLRFGREEGARLRLIGALREVDDVAIREPLEGGGYSISVTEDDIADAGTYDRVLGIAENELYTLERCLSISRSSGFPGRVTYRQVVHIERVYRGIHFGYGEVAGANGARLDFAGLTAWVARSGLTQSITVDQSGGMQAEVRGERLPDETVAIPGGGALTLRHRLWPNTQADSVGFGQKFIFELSYAAVLLDSDLIAIVSDLQDLVTIGSGRIAADRGFRRTDTAPP